MEIEIARAFHRASGGAWTVTEAEYKASLIGNVLQFISEPDASLEQIHGWLNPHEGFDKLRASLFRNIALAYIQS